MQVLKVAIISFFIIGAFSAFAAEAELVIETSESKKTFSTTDLMKLSQKITITNDPVYKDKMHYIAVSVKTLLSDYHLNDESFVEISAQDGFTSVHPVDRLLNYKKAEAFLAIESPKEPWPILPKKETSAGPFYLVWVEAKGSDIKPEEWPFQVAKFKIIKSLSEKYPKVYPVGNFSDAHPVHKGLKIFLQNCFACHTMNKEGSSEMGPDLNLPYNPMEYLQERYFWKLVRNPQDLRHWPKSQMSSFPKEVLSDQDIKDLIAYLKHMSRNKQ